MKNNPPQFGDSNLDSIEEEFEYILAKSGKSPVSENNSLAEPVMLSDGEAEFINEKMKSFGSPELYIKLESGSNK